MLYANVVLAGGSMCFPGMQSRFCLELQKRTSNFFDVSANDPLNAVFRGGTLLASMTDFPSRECDWTDGFFLEVHLKQSTVHSYLFRLAAITV